MFRNARAAGAAATASAGGGSTAVQPQFSCSTAPLPSSTGLNRVKPLCEVPDPNEHVGTLHPSRHRVDTFLVNEPLLPWPLRESVWARGMAHPQVVGSNHLAVRLALPGLLSAAGRAAMPTPYSHTEGRLLPYDAEAAPVQHCLCAAVTAAQDEPSLAPWLGPAEQHDYGSMPAAAAAVDKVFEHLHSTHDVLARVVGRRQASPAGPESGKRLQAAVLRYDTLAARAPAAYQADAARHGIRSEAAL